jgi:hypothetical protein
MNNHESSEQAFAGAQAAAPSRKRAAPRARRGTQTGTHAVFLFVGRSRSESAAAAGGTRQAGVRVPLAHVRINCVSFD